MALLLDVSIEYPSHRQGDGDYSLLVAFALADSHQEVLQVDVRFLEVEDFVNPHAAVENENDHGVNSALDLLLGRERQ